jgi:hypothetical protein
MKRGERKESIDMNAWTMLAFNGLVDRPAVVKAWLDNTDGSMTGSNMPPQPWVQTLTAEIELWVSRDAHEGARTRACEPCLLSMRAGLSSSVCTHRHVGAWGHGAHIG